MRDSRVVLSLLTKPKAIHGPADGAFRILASKCSPSSTSNSLILTCSELIHSAAAEGVSAPKSALKSVRTKWSDARLRKSSGLDASATRRTRFSSLKAHRPWTLPLGQER